MSDLLAYESETHPLYGIWKGPAILLVDLDAFFASVEQLDHPEWRGKPVIVGGHSDKHGVVATASYEARTYGVKSAMPASIAAQLCPHAIWTQGNYARYVEMSRTIMKILFKETPRVQQVSIDEAFVDISPTRTNKEHPIAIAMRIQEAIHALGVTCSIGLGTSKSVAKIASEMDKPKALTIVYPGKERDFLSPLPIGVMSGIGQKAQIALKNFGIETLGDVSQASKILLEKVFGIRSEMMQNRCRGIDESPVMPNDEIKSISSETTFSHDLLKYDDIAAAVDAMAEKVCRRLRRHNFVAFGISLKIRFSDRSVRQVQHTLKTPLDNERDMKPLLRNMIAKLWQQGQHVRLVGVNTFRLCDADTTQHAYTVNTPEEIQAHLENKSLARTSDDIKNKFGDSILYYGHERVVDNLSTGTMAKNPE
ncbi:MAG: DNA polymerase IV, partial [Eggerthellaceae bacterium]|nr:DNA polymerase IV [Eggerthellaceae bacterium]